MAPNVQTIRTFLQDHTGYHVQTDGLLRLAFDATVNKRLAMEGDAVLKFALIDDWYTTDASTEIGNNIVASVASNDNIRDFARRAGVGPHITVNPSQRGQPAGPRVLADTVEAIIGAIWIDSGKDIATVKTALATMGLAAPAST